MREASIRLIKKYYDAFNEGDMELFLSLLDDNVVHDINQGDRQVGKKIFKQFMEHMNHCYNERIADLVIMCTDDGKHAATEFVIHGVYIATDKGLPEAHGQKYSIPAGTFFEINNDGLITRVTTYYNLQEWLTLVKKQ